jgi:hypothetical protein
MRVSLNYEAQRLSRNSSIVHAARASAHAPAGVSHAHRKLFAEDSQIHVRCAAVKRIFRRKEL